MHYANVLGMPYAVVNCKCIKRSVVVSQISRLVFVVYSLLVAEAPSLLRAPGQCPLLEGRAGAGPPAHWWLSVRCRLVRLSR